MRIITVLIMLVMLVCIARADDAGPALPTIEDLFPPAPAAPPAPVSKFYTCHIEGPVSSKKEALILANTFEVSNKLPVTPHDVITQFYFNAKLRNRKLYDQMSANGGFYANCKIFESAELAGKYGLSTYEKAVKKKKQIITMQGVSFSYDTYLLYKRTQKKYK